MTHDNDTRQRILAAAAALFSRKGYHGTSTREIAAEVGIRQPSVFHHFAAKRDILAELLDRDLDPALARIRRFRETAGDPGCCLYAYLVADVSALARSPFDARGLYNDQVLDEAPMRPQRDKRSALHAEIRELIDDGVHTGVFREIERAFAQQVITGMLLDTIWAAGTGLIEDLEARPTQVADFVLLAMLADPDRIDEVRFDAARLALTGPA